MMRNALQAGWGRLPCLSGYRQRKWRVRHPPPGAGTCRRAAPPPGPLLRRPPGVLLQVLALHSLLPLAEQDGRGLPLGKGPRRGPQGTAPPPMRPPSTSLWIPRGPEMINFVKKICKT